MRIHNINNVTQAYGMQAQNAPATRKTNKKDEISISKTACDFQYAYKLAKQAPDMREEKVNEIKARIQAGTYNIDAEAVSEKIANQIDIQG